MTGWEFPFILVLNGTGIASTYPESNMKWDGKSDFIHDYAGGWQCKCLASRLAAPETGS
jgi:hypothetical protein